MARNDKELSKRLPVRFNHGRIGFRLEDGGYCIVERELAAKCAATFASTNRSRKIDATWPQLREFIQQEARLRLRPVAKLVAFAVKEPAPEPDAFMWTDKYQNLLWSSATLERALRRVRFLEAELETPWGERTQADADRF